MIRAARGNPDDNAIDALKTELRRLEAKQAEAQAVYDNHLADAADKPRQGRTNRRADAHAPESEGCPTPEREAASCEGRPLPTPPAREAPRRIEAPAADFIVSPTGETTAAPAVPVEAAAPAEKAADPPKPAQAAPSRRVLDVTGPGTAATQTAGGGTE